jgi:hypothetical protein
MNTCQRNRAANRWSVAAERTLEHTHRPLNCLEGVISAALLAATMALIGCGGGGDDATSAPDANQASPAPSPTPPATQAPVSTALSGTWSDLQAAAVYAFRVDGTFEYSATFPDIFIQEVGSYTVEQSAVTLRPTRKLYRRNGVDYEDALIVRTYGWRVEPDVLRGGRLLTLTISGGEHQFSGN